MSHNLVNTPESISQTVLMQKVATLAISGYKTSQIAKELSLSLGLVRKITKDPKFLELIEETSEKELAPLLTKAKAEMARLVSKSIKVVENCLDKDDLEAAKIVLKSVGLASQEEKQGSTELNIIMPGAKEPDTFKGDL